ncbi:MAG TPA: hypothetical protein VFA49_04590, partial [Chloroflexota bacterium]|nr:hypothetical protein [Chloroflexota bacterium]
PSGPGIADSLGGYTQLTWAEPILPRPGTSKVSYHASGWVKGGTRMTRSLPVRHVQRPTLIRQDDYAHPLRFDIVQPNELKSTDVVIRGWDCEPYVVDDEHSLTSRVFVAPLESGNAQVMFIDDDPTKGSLKSGNISDLIRQFASVAPLHNEIAKCDVRCALCHGPRTAHANAWFGARLSMLIEARLSVRDEVSVPYVTIRNKTVAKPGGLEGSEGLLAEASLARRSARGRVGCR